MIIHRNGLAFLDHHIKCGDAIVGLAHKEELENGIANEAFKKLAGDDKDVVKRLRDKNKRQIKKELIDSSYIELLDEPITELAGQCRRLNFIDQETPDDVEKARAAYQGLIAGKEWWRLKNLADIQVAQFFIPKTEENEVLCVTHGEYKDFLEGRKPLQGRDVAKAMAVSEEKRFFHWKKKLWHGSFDVARNFVRSGNKMSIFTTDPSKYPDEPFPCIQ
jgi:hypothetical protein